MPLSMNLSQDPLLLERAIHLCDLAGIEVERVQRVLPRGVQSFHLKSGSAEVSVWISPVSGNHLTELLPWFDTCIPLLDRLCLSLNLQLEPVGLFRTAEISRYNAPLETSDLTNEGQCNGICLFAYEAAAGEFYLTFSKAALEREFVDRAA
jgi:hypothetical protein